MYELNLWNRSYDETYLSQLAILATRISRRTDWRTNIKSFSCMNVVLLVRTNIGTANANRSAKAQKSFFPLRMELLDVGFRLAFTTKLCDKKEIKQLPRKAGITRSFVDVRNWAWGQNLWEKNVKFTIDFFVMVCHFELPCLFGTLLTRKDHFIRALLGCRWRGSHWLAVIEILKTKTCNHYDETKKLKKKH